MNTDAHDNHIERYEESEGDFSDIPFAPPAKLETTKTYTDLAKYTVVEFINAFGTKAYALRSPSGVDIDTDYANEQKLQRRADDLNKEIEVASAKLRMRNMELEAKNAKMKEAIEGVLYLTNQDVEDGLRIDIPKLVAYRLRLKDALKAEQAPTEQAASEVPAALDKPFYSVKEHVETTYKVSDWDGKRYPSDYSIFTVVGPNGGTVDSFSALEHGLDDAEYLANELRDKLNKAVQS